jgi:hypothetical protein
MKGAFFNDGVTLIQQSGKEYQNIEPLWNWTMLPGTTCDTTLKPNSDAVFKTNNTGLFTGLVSDGANGISAMDYQRLGIKAQKSYFMINGILVALGAGIESPDMKNVVTTVNQCYYKGKVIKSTPNSGGPQWVLHDNTGYLFLNNTIAKTTVKKHTGAWNTIDGASTAQVLTDSIFTLYVPQSTSNTYAYMVKPEATATNMAQVAKRNPIEVISNTAKVQAIQWGMTAMAVFYQPGLLKFDAIQVETDKPCMLICKTTAGKQQLWVSDPSRSQTTINVSFNGKLHNVTLPKGDYLGSTVKVD